MSSLGHSHLNSRWGLAVRMGAVAAALTTSLTGQHLAFATHDWQRLTATGFNASGAWSDVKTPGDGRTYAVGSTWTDRTDHLGGPVTFSGVGFQGSMSPTQGPLLTASGQGAIVAILQATSADGAILWQRFFHGDGGATSPDTTTTTRGRSVSVFPGATPQATRVAICGETFDRRLPLSAAESGLSQTLSQGATSGFVAVYNGEDDLLWTHLLFGSDSQASTTLTDLSIRVDTSGSVPRDIVTYCGISTNGQYEPPTGSVPTPLTPVREFTTLPTPSALPCGGDLYALGNENNHPLDSLSVPQDNPDGIVGRVVYTPSVGTAPASLVTQFHTLVGGDDHDSLWGLVERDADRFAVVGVTKLRAQGGTVFPLSRPRFRDSDPLVCLSTPGSSSFQHGVLVEFNAVAATVGGPVFLTGSTLIGRSGFVTVARDVIWQGGEYCVVGSTTDPSFGSLNFAGGSCSSSSGFLVATPDPNGDFTQVQSFPGPSSGHAMLPV
jgi:hypothetical protein